MVKSDHTLCKVPYSFAYALMAVLIFLCVPLFADPETPGLLKLEATVEGKTTLYPGQQTKFIYRYYFSGDIALTVEVLPLLEAQGMVKVGEKEIKDYTQGNISVREVAQMVEAKNPGNYVYGPSKAEGVITITKGQGDTNQQKLSSIAPPVTIRVIPFPEEGKPLAFNGAVGSFQFSAEIEAKKKWVIGDEIPITLKITGEGNFDSVKAPDVVAQPGFRGFFKLSDLPLNVVMHPNEKKITLLLRPITDQVNEIPAIEFAFFDPKSGGYVVRRSIPIPITFSEVKNKAQPKETFPKKAVEISKPLEKVKAQAAKFVEIQESMLLSQQSLYNRIFGTWWVLLAFASFAVCVFQQLCIKRYIQEAEAQERRYSGDELFRHALKEKKGSRQFYAGIALALKQALYERRWIQQPDIADEALKGEETVEKVKAFLLEMSRQRFAPGVTLDDEWVISEAKKLLKVIEEGERQ